MAVDRTPVIIDGPCVSACTVFADIDRANVCVTTNAVFGYHQEQYEKADGKTTYDDIVYQDASLNAYIKGHGGLPSPDSGDLLMLNFHQLTQFYKPCAGAA